MEADSRTYNSWRSMVQRCHYPADIKHRWYGGRGIVVCQRWRKFQNFLADMGKRPDGMTIHRVNNDGNYELGNCRWATWEEQRACRGRILPKTSNVLTRRRDADMGLQQEIERLSENAALVAIKNDLLATAHKLRYPMASILAKVPGESLAARARAIGVSRQTMYVWAQERFRPSPPQAEIISQLTGIPMEQIGEFHEGNDDTDVGEPPRKTRPRLGKISRNLSPGAARLRAKRRGMAAQQGKR